MHRQRYDYFLHATVPVEEDWGLALPRPPSGPVGRERLGAAPSEPSDPLVQCGTSLAEYKRGNYQLALREQEAATVRCRSLPPFIQASRMDRCNLSCVYCRPDRQQGGTVLEPSVWRRALEVLLPAALELQPYCWGEALLDPEFPQTCELARRHEVPVSLITNLQWLTDELAEQVVASVSRALVSVDCTAPAEFARLRRGASFARLEGHLEALGAAARALRRPLPWLGISVVLMRRNLSGVPELLRWAHDRGFRGVCARRLVVREGIRGFGAKELIDLSSRSYARVHAECRSFCDSRGMALSMPDPSGPPDPGPLGCPCPWTHVYLSPAGTLSLCCYSHQTVVGSLPLQDGFWNSPQLIRIRRDYRPSHRCAECASLDFIGRPDVSQLRGY